MVSTSTLCTCIPVHREIYQDTGTRMGQQGISAPRLSACEACLPDAPSGPNTDIHRRRHLTLWLRRVWAVALQASGLMSIAISCAGAPPIALSMIATEQITKPLPQPISNTLQADELQG